MFPLSFTSPVDEHLNVRKNVGMQDLSSMGEVAIKLARVHLSNRYLVKFSRFRPARGGEVDLLLSRSGSSGELGYELYAPAEQALILWDLLLVAGKEFRLQPYGAAAMQSLRIEKSLP